MDHKLSCGIVRDLLPSYVDGLTCEETNLAVETHLIGCTDCRKMYELMKEPEESKVGEAEVDYLKKVRRRGNRKAFVMALLGIAVFVAVFSIRIFLFGYEAEASEVLYQAEVTDQMLIVRGRLKGSGTGIARVAVEKVKDEVQIQIYTAPRAFINQGEFVASYPLSDEINRVSLGDLILWEEGTVISRTAARLYEKQNPYVGNMPANAEVADILFGIFDGLDFFGKYGTYNNNLQTAAEPYGWEIRLREDQQSDEDALYESMKNDSYAMLAAIGNLGYVQWEFENNGETIQYTFTAEAASEYTGEDIKSWSESASKMQKLCEILGI